MLLTQLLTTKLQCGTAFSEYQLMRWLQAPEQAVFAADALTEPVSLFQAHFLLQHALYQLQQRWAAKRHAWLEISALHIQKHAWPVTGSTTDTLAQHNKLADFYLDMSNFSTSKDQVDALLADFWRRMHSPQIYQQDLQILELSQGFSQVELKRQYKKLAMRYHPDRGGSTDKFCQIQAAYERLYQPESRPC